MQRFAPICYALLLSLGSPACWAAPSYSWLQLYGLQLTLCFLVAQTIVVFWLLHKLRLRSNMKSDDPILQKTKYQLRREIARHEATEEQLLETREYLNGIINSLPAVVIGVTEDSHVTHWNVAAERATGVAKEHAMGQKLMAVMHAPDIPQEQIFATIKGGVSFKKEAVAIGSGVDTQYCDLTIQPLISAENSGAVILVQDVTLRVRVERSMIQNEKMLSLGKMAAGLAHEINNPLAAILSNAQTIERRLTSKLQSNIDSAEASDLNFAALQQYLDKRDIPKLILDVQNAGDRAALIVKTMLEFSHAYQAQFEYVDIGVLVDKSLELAANTLGLNTSENMQMPFVIRDFNAAVPMVPCSRSEIQQVLLNLLLNAAQAIHYANPRVENPTIIVRLTNDKHFAVIEVQDNGPGMDESIQKHIFEPFFTTKEVGAGTGLGLSVSYFIVKEHHQGHIEVNSKAGHGTNFVIKLPLVQALADQQNRQTAMRRKV